MVKNLTNLEKTIGKIFLDKSLLVEALTHRSYLNEVGEPRSSNERLEFLGDAILSYVVSKHLFSLFPGMTEGELTGIRSAIVKTQTLSDAAQKIDLGNCLFLSRGEEEGGGRFNPTLLANVFEALIGAIHEDRGIEEALHFISIWLFPIIPDIVKYKRYVDYKSSVQELVQEKFRISPLYKVIKEEGPDHAKHFWIGLFIKKKQIGSGDGKSKQEAEQQAAKSALEKWEEIV